MDRKSNVVKRRRTRRKGAKSKRSYQSTDIFEAAKMVKELNLSVYKAAKDFNVPWTTLKAYIIRGDEGVLPKMGRPFTKK